MLNPDYTVVITSYYEEKSLEEHYARLCAGLHVIEQEGKSWEIVMINDGSKDGTWQIMKRLYAADHRIAAAIDFVKNSGQAAAMTAGICHARGRAIVFIDSDLQLDPEELPRLTHEFEKGFDLVTGYRTKRKDSWSRIIPSKLANMIMRRASGLNIRDFGCTFKVWNGTVLRAFNYGPFKLFNTASTMAMIENVLEIPVNHHARIHGKSGWTFRKLWQFNMDNLVNVSQKPFQIVAALCVFTAAIFALRVVWDFFMPFRILNEVSNGLVLNVLIVSGILNVALLCVIGEFAIRVFLNTQREPKYIIREKLTRTD